MADAEPDEDRPTPKPKGKGNGTFHLKGYGLDLEASSTSAVVLVIVAIVLAVGGAIVLSLREHGARRAENAALIDLSKDILVELRLQNHYTGPTRHGPTSK